MDWLSRLDSPHARQRQVQGADHYSGVLVLTLPGQFDSCVEALAGHEGVTVAVRDPDRDRMIVVLEANSREHLEALHWQVSAVPGVVTADPIVHYVDDPSRDLSTGP